MSSNIDAVIRGWHSIIRYFDDLHASLIEIDNIISTFRLSINQKYWYAGNKINKPSIYNLKERQFKYLSSVIKQ